MSSSESFITVKLTRGTGYSRCRPCFKSWVDRRCCSTSCACIGDKFLQPLFIDYWFYTIFTFCSLVILWGIGSYITSTTGSFYSWLVFVFIPSFTTKMTVIIPCPWCPPSTKGWTIWFFFRISIRNLGTCFTPSHLPSICEICSSMVSCLTSISTLLTRRTWVLDSSIYPFHVFPASVSFIKLWIPFW